MRIFISFLITAALLPFAVNDALAQQPVSGSGEWYYAIGGAEPVSAAPNATVFTAEITGSDGLRLPNACSSLDPVASVSNILDDIKDGVDQFESAMVLAANNAIAALPSIVLQRALPGVYDHFQNALIRAEAQVDFAVKSCREMVDDAATGQDPFRDWVKVSRRNTMRAEILTPGNDPVSAAENVDLANGDDGVPWLGGANAGGADQPPIRVVHDTVRAGYNIILGEPPENSAPPAVTGTPPRIVELWPDPIAAADWGQQVLGDEIITTCQGCVPGTVPGTGLLPRYEAEKVALRPLIVDLVAGASDPTPTNRRAASASNIEVTTQLISAIRNISDDQERDLAVGRLVSDIATARTVEKALAIRRAIITGQKVPEISGVREALDAQADLVDIIEREIDNFLYEDQIRERLVSRTAQIVLEREESRRQLARDQSVTDPSDPNPLINGKVE